MDPLPVSQKKAKTKWQQQLDVGKTETEHDLYSVSPKGDNLLDRWARVTPGLDSPRGPPGGAGAGEAVVVVEGAQPLGV